MPIVYNTYKDLAAILRATGGGVNFSGNLKDQCDFDYFPDAPQVNDALYFGVNPGVQGISNLKFCIGTPMAGTYTLVWEYSRYQGVGMPVWTPVPGLADGTNGFRNPGERIVSFNCPPILTYCHLGGTYNLMWIRCRLAALTAVTEGGAQSSQKVQGGDATVEWTGYTDAAPLTPQELYDWFAANHPEVGCQQIQDFYFFPVYPKMSSRFKMTSGCVAFGNGSSSFFDLSYLQIGEKTSTGGVPAMVADRTALLLLYNSYVGGVFTTTTVNTRNYGGRILGRPYTDGGVTINPGWQPAIRKGEHLDAVVGPYPGSEAELTTLRCYADGRYPDDNAHLVDCLVSTPYLFSRTTLTDCQLASGAADYPVSLRAVYPTSYLEVVNPRPALPELAMTRTGDHPEVLIAGPTYCLKVFDQATGTFTDHTAQGAPVPLYGGSAPKVGDCLYFGAAGARNYLRMVLHSPNLDNQYVWEGYIRGAWVDLESRGMWQGVVWDGTRVNGVQFAQDGKIWFQSPYQQQYDFTATTIDGFTGYFIRLRVTVAGSSRPQTAALYTAVGWNSSAHEATLWEKFTLELGVSDQSGGPVSGATVTLRDNQGAVAFQASTGEDGTIPRQTVTSRFWRFDPVAVPDFPHIRRFNLGPFQLTVSQTGFATYRDVLTLTEKQKLQVALSPPATGYLPVPSGEFHIEAQPVGHLEVALSSPQMEVTLHD